MYNEGTKGSLKVWFDGLVLVKGGQVVSGCKKNYEKVSTALKV